MINQANDKTIFAGREICPLFFNKYENRNSRRKKCVSRKKHNDLNS